MTYYFSRINLFFQRKLANMHYSSILLGGRIIMFHPPPPKIWTGTGNLQRPNVKWSSFGKPMRFSLPALSGKEIGGKKHLTLQSSRIVPTLSQGGNVLSPIHVIICSLQKYLQDFSHSGFNRLNLSPWIQLLPPMLLYVFNDLPEGISQLLYIDTK